MLCKTSTSLLFWKQQAAGKNTPKLLRRCQSYGIILQRLISNWNLSAISLNYLQCNRDKKEPMGGFPSVHRVARWLKRSAAKSFMICGQIRPNNFVVFSAKFGQTTSLYFRPNSAKQLRCIFGQIRLNNYFKQPNFGQILCSNKCCRDSIVTKNMVEHFTSKNMYSNANDEQDEDAPKEDDELMVLRYVWIERC